PLYTLNISALNARGKSKITFRVEIIKKALILVSLLFTFSFGIITMLWGYAAASIISYLISIIYLKKEITHYIKHQVLDFIQSFIFGLLIAALIAIIGLATDKSILILPIQITAAAIVYILILKQFYNDLYNKSVIYIKEKLLTINRNKR
nr:polysaccharide biosynthesis C-terminal domain-containing protein [Paludibacter sp.]